MTIVLCGGGSGGHITPLLPVASELRKQDKTIRLVYIGERHGKFTGITKDSRLFDELHEISAGKLRRYHGEAWLKRLLDIKTNILNIRDVFRLSAGVVQSYFLIKKLRPAAILLKGGFVCVPVALAAKLNRVPYITHDSDALPGMSNRIAGRWARYHATGMPAQYYRYPQQKVRVVGVSTDERFRIYSTSEQRLLREKYGIAPAAPTLLVTGGSLGARRLNAAVAAILPDLFTVLPDLQVFHQLGAGNDDQRINDKRVTSFDFSNELFHMSALADVVITRAGATILADLAGQSKACILVPNPALTGGHQLKNAQVYKDGQAALVVFEQELPEGLLEATRTLLHDARMREQLGGNLHKTLPPQNAAHALAELLMEIAQ